MKTISIYKIKNKKVSEEKFYRELWYLTQDQVEFKIIRKGRNKNEKFIITNKLTT